MPPNWAPTTFAAASTSANFHSTKPPAMNTTSAPVFVAVLITFAIAADCRNDWVNTAVNPIMRNMPVPGPRWPAR